MSKEEQEKTKDSEEACNCENKKAEAEKAGDEKSTQSCKEEKSCEDEKKDAKQEKPAEKTDAEKLCECEKTIAELKDQYLRKCADFDNYRKRMLREKQDAFDYANANLLTDLLSLLDDLERTLAASENAKDNEVAKPLIDGVAMIQKQLKNMLESKYNLVAFGSEGDAFDPELHEALASNPSAVAEPQIAQVYLRGYKLKERILRHAKVAVAMPNGEVKNDDNSSEK